MMPRTFANFMNAMTSLDNTLYPFATTNRKDFNNLMSVYLDATLDPLLRETDFRQEGWRIGPNNPLGGSEVSDQDLVFKGVVYNEMKGQMSDAGYLYYIHFLKHIFPDGKNSGGDPQKMTDLTYTDLKNFHAQNYHPTNAKIFSYGDIPLAEHLLEVDKKLSPFNRREADKTIKAPIDLSNGPLFYAVKGPVDPLIDRQMQFRTSTSWVMGEISNALECVALGIMSAYLLNGYGSPFYQGLIDAGLGPDFSVNTGFDFFGRKGIFSVGLNGVKEVDVPRVKDATKDILYDVYQKGFDKTKIEGLLHQKELGQKHKTADFGMSAMNLSVPRWFNGGDPFDMLSWNELAADFRSKLANGNYLETLLEKHLLNNRTLTLTMEPIDNYSTSLLMEEAGRLSNKIAEVSVATGSESAAKASLIKQEMDLLEVQKEEPPHKLACLPTLNVTDIPRQMERKSIRDSLEDQVKVQWREASTNGLTYFRAINTLDGLPTELRYLLPLFTETLLRLGTKDRSIEELEDTIKLRTGGISASYYSNTSLFETQKATEGLLFSGFALDENVPMMYELLRTLLQETDFDGPDVESRITALLQNTMSSSLDNVAASGQLFARSYAEASLSPGGLFAEQTTGLTQIQQVSSYISQSLQVGVGEIISKLKTIQSFALSRSPNLRVALTCSPESVPGNEQALRKFLSAIPSSTTIPLSTPSLPAFSSKTFFTLPYQVYYSAVAIPTVPYINSSSPHLQLLSEILEPKIHNEVREKGGAYDGSPYFSSLSGVLGFHSYRDPNPQNTIKVVNDVGNWITDEALSNAKLNAAKISLFKKLDTPENINEEGMVRFLSGVNEEMEQDRRERLLASDINDIKAAAQQFLVQDMGKARIAILGEKQDWVKASEGWDIKNIDVADPATELATSSR